jgi:peptidoglycan biosynthesis protein MviN/MurJ (putative lipid II flippase)
VQQVAVRGFYARSEMWRAMGLSSAIAVGVLPLYLVGGQALGVEGLALASIAAISLNALVTLVWLRARAGSPDLLALAGSLARSLAIAGLAGGAAWLVASALAIPGRPHALVFVGGAAAYGVVALAGVRLLGDAPLRAGIDGVVRRLKLRRPAKGPA